MQKQQGQLNVTHVRLFMWTFLCILNSFMFWSDQWYFTLGAWVTRPIIFVMMYISVRRIR